MRVRNLLALSVVLLLSVGLATAAAAKSKFAASQQMCLSSGGTNVVFSTKGNSSFYGSSYKGERVLWTCNGFSNSSAAQPLGGSCLNDGGKSARVDAPGFVTCWKN
jgi:hypothetical protein